MINKLDCLLCYMALSVAESDFGSLSPPSLPPAPPGSATVCPLSPEANLVL